MLVLKILGTIALLAFLADFIWSLSGLGNEKREKQRSDFWRPIGEWVGCFLMAVLSLGILGSIIGIVILAILAIWGGLG